ncbi:MAG TPA: hypothetical protein VLJ38_12630 [Polyangiaceae bacterium]|nr:hypothetical protein [Polyangiaceae bacterium]
MLERCLLPAALFFGCAPAVTLPVVAPAASPSAAAQAAVNVMSPARVHRGRHVARLSPPFAAAGGIRHVADSDAPTAVATTP